MKYMTLYRKYRPAVFDDVIGQENVVTTLRNQIISGRISHAYLFCGTHGTGKTTLAKIFAKAVNCEKPVDGSPCNQCEICKRISSGASVNVVEIDAASNNGVDNIRNIIEDVSYRPTEGKYRVYIIDEVHMLSAGAFNALLKTLEEPPEYVIFILATTEVGKIPVTILSRCQRYDFKRVSSAKIFDRLKKLSDSEGLDYEDAALRYIAGICDGSVRDALSLLDQCIASAKEGKLTYQGIFTSLSAVDPSLYNHITLCISEGDTASVMREFNKILSEGKDPRQFIGDFVHFLRDLLMINYGVGKDSDLIDVSSDIYTGMEELSSKIGDKELIRYIRVLSGTLSEMRLTDDERTLAEICLIKLSKPQMQQDNASLLSRIDALEKSNEKLKQIIESGSFIPNNMTRDPLMGNVENEASGFNGEQNGYDPLMPDVSEIYEIPDLKNMDVSGNFDVSGNMTESSGSFDIEAAWNDIAGEIRSPIESRALKHSKVHLDDDTVIAEISGFLSEGIDKNLELVNEIKNIIKRKFNRDLDVKFIVANTSEDKQSDPDEIEEAIRNKINIDIIEE